MISAYHAELRDLLSRYAVRGHLPWHQPPESKTYLEWSFHLALSQALAIARKHQFRF